MKENASQIKEEARKLGLTEEDIFQCIEHAFSGENDQQDLANSPNNIVRKVVRHFRIFFKKVFVCTLVVAALIFGSILIAGYHEPTGQLVSKSFQTYAYDIMRAVRLATVGIHDWANLTEFYNAECLVENPYFEELNYFHCNICGNFKNLKVMNASEMNETRFITYSTTLKPVHLKGALDNEVSYKHLRDMYLANKDSLLESIHNVYSEDENIKTLQDVFERDIGALINTTSLQIHWITRSVIASVVLRNVFPRPKFIPSKYEVRLEKQVFIDGPNTPTHDLVIQRNTVYVYIQASGNRRVLTRPVKNCRNTCNSLLAFMTPGDALMFHSDIWRPYVAVSSEEPSIGYLLSVSF